MPSRVRHTTSNSGASSRSTKKRAASSTQSRSLNSSATAPASFEKIFGKGESLEIQRCRASLQIAKERLLAHKAVPQPKMALLRVRHLQRLYQAQKRVRDITEYLNHLTGTQNADKGSE